MSKNNRTVDRIQAVWNILGGEDGVDALLRGELVVKAVIWTEKIWNKIKIGTFKNIDEMRKALKKANVNVGEWASDIIGKPAFTLSTKEEEFELVNVSPAELGFKGNTNRKEIYDRALKSGLELCPAEVGPQAALQFGSQLKNGECFVIGMEPITDSVSNLSVFYVRRPDDGKLWLSANYGDPDFIWYADDRFVFMRRKK